MTCEIFRWSDQQHMYLKVPHIHIQCLQTQLEGPLSQRGCQGSNLDTAQTSPFPVDTQG